MQLARKALLTRTVWRSSQQTSSAVRAMEPHIYSLGHSIRVDRAALHGGLRSRLLQTLRAAQPTSPPGVLLFQGGSASYVSSADGERLFQQEPYMHHLFGCEA
jgi:hypothetical protein